MNRADWVQLAIALGLAILAGLTAAAEAALYSFSKARADRLVAEGHRGAAKVRKIVDDPPRYLNTALFVRTVLEIVGIVLVALGGVRQSSRRPGRRVLITAGSMIVVSYIFWGVAPRTLGRQHADAVACAAGRTAGRDDHGARPAAAPADHDRQRAHARARASSTGRSPPRPSCASWSTWPRPAR